MGVVNADGGKAIATLPTGVGHQCDALWLINPNATTRRER